MTTIAAPRKATAAPTPPVPAPARAGIRLPADLDLYTDRPITIATATSGGGVYKHKMVLHPDTVVRLGPISGVSVDDAAKAAQQIMGFPSPSWVVMHSKDGNRYIAQTIDPGGRFDCIKRPADKYGINIDADTFSSVKVLKRTDLVDAVVGYHTVQKDLELNPWPGPGW